MITCYSEETIESHEAQISLNDLTLHQRDSLESELTLAARIQQALLPAPGFTSGGWEVCYHYAPSGVLSGDYCDFFETDSGLLFLVGDVCGKGIGASLLMTQLRAAFRTLAESDPPLDLMVEAANRLFAECTLDGQFATIIVGRADRDGWVEFVSAGHLPLLRLSSCSVHAECATSIPIGVFTDVRFPVRRLFLKPGDSLFLFTDGLTESHNPLGEEYGLSRLTSVVAAHTQAKPTHLISVCLEDLAAFTCGTLRSDDLTVMTVRRVA